MGGTRGAPLLNAARWDGEDANQSRPFPSRAPSAARRAGTGGGGCVYWGGGTRRRQERNAPSDRGRCEQAEGRQRCQRCDELCRPQLCGTSGIQRGSGTALPRPEGVLGGLPFLPPPFPPPNAPQRLLPLLHRSCFGKKKENTKPNKKRKARSGKRGCGSCFNAHGCCSRPPPPPPPIPRRAAADTVLLGGGNPACSPARLHAPRAPIPGCLCGCAVPMGRGRGGHVGGGGSPHGTHGFYLQGTHCCSAPKRRAPSIPLRPSGGLSASPAHPAGPAAPRGPAPVGAEHCRAGGSRGQPRYAHGTDPARRCCVTPLPAAPSSPAHGTPYPRVPSL